MQVSVIAIGDELLIGQVVDTNSGEIARRIAPLGWSLHDVQVVHDDEQLITQAIDRALANSQIVITTGGLGPTKDDITKATLCKIFGGEMRLDVDVLQNVREVFARRGLAMNRLTESQAMVPSSCAVIQNTLGTAPIMWFERDGRVLVSMPGVPFEMTGMLDREVLPRLRRHFGVDGSLAHRTFMVADITESDLAQRLEPFEDSLPRHLHLAYLPQPGLIRLRLDGYLPQSEAKALNADIDHYCASLRSLLGDNLIIEGDLAPAQILLHFLKEKGLSVATAESCTGGNIAHSITAIAGSSECYRGTVVAYHNDIKTSLLGVPSGTLESHGAVSEPTVRAMVQGAQKALGAQCAIATSGIAGPTGAVPGKPVGTVWIAVADGENIVAQSHHFPGNRTRVIERATTTALLSLAKLLKTR